MIKCLRFSGSHWMGVLSNGIILKSYGNYSNIIPFNFGYLYVLDETMEYIDQSKPFLECPF